MSRHDTEHDAAAVYIAGAVADGKTINELLTQLTAAVARAEKAEKERDALRVQLAACASDATAALTEIRFDGQTVFGTLYAKPGEEPI